MGPAHTVIQKMYGNWLSLDSALLIYRGHLFLEELTKGTP